jgi:hypothetical protein
MNNINQQIENGFLDKLSKSPIMIGIAVLMINLSGRYLANDITQYDEKVLNNKFMKKLTIFSIAFLSTRDIKYSIIIVFLYTLLFNPCGLAYKIIKYTNQLLVNPFSFRKNYILDNNPIQKKKRKITIHKLKL